MAQILVVALKPDSSAAMMLLGGSGHEVVFAGGFEAAVRKLDHIAPDVLVSEVRLAGFNGIHLVIRSQTTRPNMRSILLDRSHDPVIALDAQQHGAVYLAGPVTAATLLGHVTRLLADNTPQRRWPRKQLTPGLVAHIARRKARVIDISYGGIRVEMPPSGSIPARFNMAIPGFEVVFRARPVWTQFTPLGAISCGAELSEANPQTVAQWRQLVDSIQGAA